MIQRTALWIFATLAFCSPGVSWFNGVATVPAAGQMVQSVQNGLEHSNSRKTQTPTHTLEIGIRYVDSPNVSNPGRRFFGSLYNRPPPLSLSRS